MINILKYQTTGKRIGAAVIDSIVFLPISLLSNELVISEAEWIRTGGGMLETILWAFYVVIGHGKYGQTVGKKLMQIKVLDVSETRFISYRRAILREGIWFFLVIVSYINWYFFPTDYYDADNNIGFDGYISLISLLWFLIEIVTMLFNDKRRALHDFIAGSVVVNTVEMAREKANIYEEMTGSFQEDENQQKDTL